MFFHIVYKSGQIFLPFCHNSRVWRTDRRTDRQTDRILIARPRLHSMQRGKKRYILKYFNRKISSLHHQTHATRKPDGSIFYRTRCSTRI